MSKKLLQAAKCALADLEGCLDNPGCEPDYDVIRKTVRELRAAIAEPSRQLGFLAVGGGQVIQLTKPTGPRKQLLEHFNRQHCRKVWVDHKDGTTAHVGWIVAGIWFDVYRVLPLEGLA